MMNIELRYNRPNNSRLKLLNQKDFSLTLIADLGMLYPTNTSTTLVRYGIFICPRCSKEMTSPVTAIKQNKIQTCKPCGHMTHGLKHHILYEVWKNMIYRCYNSKSREFERYKDRFVSEEFKNITIFINYIETLPNYINRKKENLSLDRIDNNKNYERGNLRWATKTVQVQNTKKLRKTNTSGYRGVFLDKRHKGLTPYFSNIRVNGTRKHLGMFKTPLEASYAYDKYIKDNNLEHTKNH